MRVSSQSLIKLLKNPGFRFAMDLGGAQLALHGIASSQHESASPSPSLDADPRDPTEEAGEAGETMRSTSPTGMPFFIGVTTARAGSSSVDRADMAVVRRFELSRKDASEVWLLTAGMAGGCECEVRREWMRRGGSSWRAGDGLCAVGGWRLVKATAVAGKNAVDGSN